MCTAVYTMPLCLHLSITLVYCTKTTQSIIMQPMPDGSLWTQLSHTKDLDKIPKGPDWSPQQWAIFNQSHCILEKY